MEKLDFKYARRKEYPRFIHDPGMIF